MAAPVPPRERRGGTRRELLGFVAVAVVIGMVIAAAVVTGGLRPAPGPPTLQPGQSVTNHRFKITLVSQAAKIIRAKNSYSDKVKSKLVIKFRVRNLGKEAASSFEFEQAIQARITPGGKLNQNKQLSSDIQIPGHSTTLQPGLTYPLYAVWKLEPAQQSPHRISIEIVDYEYRRSSLSKLKNWFTETNQPVATVTLPVQDGSS